MVHQHTVAGDRAAPDPAAQLVQLGQPEALGIFDNHQAGVGHVDAHFDDGGGDQQLQLATLELLHHRGFLGRFHAPVDQPDAQPDSGGDGGEGDSGGESDGGGDGGDNDGGDGGGDNDGGDGGGESKDGGANDAGDGGSGNDGGRDDTPKEQMKPPPESMAPRSSRMLEDLREAPTYQEKQAEQRAKSSRRRPVMEDK